MKAKYFYCGPNPWVAPGDNLLKITPRKLERFFFNIFIKIYDFEMAFRLKTLPLGVTL